VDRTFVRISSSVLLADQYWTITKVMEFAVTEEAAQLPLLNGPVSARRLRLLSKNAINRVRSRFLLAARTAALRAHLNMSHNAPPARKQFTASRSQIDA
jgi:hypothetical protein